MFLVALVIHLKSRRGSSPARVLTGRGVSYLLLGIALPLGSGGDTDWLSWLLRVMGVLTFVLGVMWLLVVRKGRRQQQAKSSISTGSEYVPLLTKDGTDTCLLEDGHVKARER